MTNMGNSSGNGGRMKLQPLADFVGRVGELEGILEALSLSTRAWIISLTGVGGIGKSELAIKAADMALDRKLFSSVVWVTAKESWLTYEGITRKEYTFVSLDDLLNTIIDDLGLNPRPKEQSPEQPKEISLERKKALVAQALRSQPCLLIVDNLETIQDQAIIQFLINFPPGPSKALVTTRLGGLKAPDAAPAQSLEGQREIRVGPLSQEDAITLFLHRAEGHNMHFSREAHEEQIIKIIARSAGIPLAIEWITSRMAFKNEDLATTIERFDSSHGNLLEYCFDSLIATVGSRGKKVLLAVSVFADSVNEQTLGAVTKMEIEDQAKELELLNAASLLEKFGKRFRVLAPTRLYASTLQNSLSEVYQEYCITATKNYIRLLHDVEELQQWNSAESEQHNILTLLTWCFDKGELELAFELAHALSGYLNRLGSWDQLVYVCELATRAAEGLGNVHEAIQFTYDAAEIHKARGRLDEAFAEFQNCEKYSREIGDKQKEAHAHMQAGIILYQQHRYNDSIKFLQESLEMQKANGDQKGAVITLSILGRNELKLGNLDQAQQYFEDSLRHKQQIKDLLGIAISQYDLGHLHHLRGDFKKAQSYLEDSIDMLKPGRVRRHIANAEWYYALLNIDLDNLEAARKLLTDVVSLEETLQRDRKVKRASEKLVEVEKTMNARKGMADTGKLRAVPPTPKEPPPDLALQLIHTLYSYASSSSGAFSQKYGTGASTNAASILATLQQSWANDDEASNTLLVFTKKPERYKSALQDILQENLAQNHDLAMQLSQILYRAETQ
ncbi:MAG TPA: tetratricopeptide repeat protein [Ktedonobacteraceae bacterium]|nr:tetratricopeptide repeat protein [Ktedonobacteraceae bacterium]